MLNWLKDVRNKISDWLNKNAREEKVSFIKEDGLWYFDFPNYPLSKHNLLMVNGSDKLLDFIAEDHSQTSMKVYFCEELPEDFNRLESIVLTRTHGHELAGYYYNVESNFPMMKEAYFCPVMFFKYGYYPKYIIIDQTSVINKN